MTMRVVTRIGGVIRRGRSVRHCVSGAVLTTGVALCFLLLPSAASSSGLGPAFPPGFWCGVGKAPVGKTITIKARRLTFVSGKMNFILSSEKGDAAGDL